eukprot:m.7125 g.7125  ORF g.7125 m.7125 type:complete len:234 (-) comp5660_c0_seq1:1271-1972(-)
MHNDIQKLKRAFFMSRSPSFVIERDGGYDIWAPIKLWGKLSGDRIFQELPYSSESHLSTDKTRESRFEVQQMHLVKQLNSPRMDMCLVASKEGVFLFSHLLWTLNYTPSSLLFTDKSENNTVTNYDDKDEDEEERNCRNNSSKSERVTPNSGSDENSDRSSDGGSSPSFVLEEDFGGAIFRVSSSGALVYAYNDFFLAIWQVNADFTLTLAQKLTVQQTLCDLQPIADTSVFS